MEDGAQWGFKPKSSPSSCSLTSSSSFPLGFSHSHAPALHCFRWEQVVDLTYSLRLGAKPKPMEQDEAAVEKLRYELFPSFCCGWVQAAVCPWVLRQPPPTDQGERGEDRQRGTALLGTVLS